MKKLSFRCVNDFNRRTRENGKFQTINAKHENAEAYRFTRVQHNVTSRIAPGLSVEFVLFVNRGFDGHSPRDNRQTSHVLHSVLDERSDGKTTDGGKWIFE